MLSIYTTVYFGGTISGLEEAEQEQRHDIHTATCAVWVYYLHLQVAHRFG